MELENLDNLIEKYNVQIKDVQNIKYSLKRCSDFKEYKAMHIDGLTKIEDIMIQIKETLRQIEYDSNMPSSVTACANYTSRIQNVEDVFDFNYMAHFQAESETVKDLIERINAFASQLDELRSLEREMHESYSPAKVFPYSTYSLETFKDTLQKIKTAIIGLSVGSVALGAIDVLLWKECIESFINDSIAAPALAAVNVIPTFVLGTLLWGIGAEINEYKKEKAELNKFETNENAYKYRRIN